MSRRNIAVWPTDDDFQPGLDELHQHRVYTDGRREFIIPFSGGSPTGYSPFRERDTGRVRIAYMNQDGTEPTLPAAVYDWIEPELIEYARELP